LWRRLSVVMMRRWTRAFIPLYSSGNMYAMAAAWVRREVHRGLWNIRIHDGGEVFAEYNTFQL
jgi:hypothetical protein